MKKLIIGLLILPFLFISVHAAAIEIPQVPDDAQAYMPHEDQTFAQGLLYVLTTAVGNLMPDLAEGMKTGLILILTALILSLIGSFKGSGTQTAELIGIIFSTTVMLNSSHSLIQLGIQTITGMDAYGKMLLPVMTTVLASGGAITSSAALYAGTSIFSAILTTVLTKLFTPLLYTYIAVCVASRAIGENMLESIKKFLKWLMTWLLKIILYVFTGYITISGVVSGTTDAMSLKATKITLSGMIPVVGGIISDASEAILVSAGIMKSAAGIYGIYAFLSLCIGPVLKITVHCVILKITAALCSVFSSKQQSGLVDDFSAAMSMILAATGSLCLLLLISTVAFMKGAV